MSTYDHECLQVLSVSAEDVSPLSPTSNCNFHPLEAWVGCLIDK